MTASPRIALVTGGNKGIGRAVVQQLAELGMTVYLGSRDEARGRAAEAELRRAGLDVHFLRVDLNDESSALLAAKQIDEHNGRLDVLVNNAGFSNAWQPPSQTPVDEVRRVLDTNVLGTIAVTNAMLPLLRRSDAARIVNVSSTLGSLTAASQNFDPTGTIPPGSFPAMIGYTTSKAALNSVTVMYALELREEGILVNSACPGHVATDINGGSGEGRATQDGARIPVMLATLPDGGPTGSFTGSDSELTPIQLPW